MKKLAYISIGLLGFLAILTAASYIIGNKRMNTRYNIPVAKDFKIPTDQASIDEGLRLATIRQCVECHKYNFEGRVEYDTFYQGRLVIPNLTTGKGGRKLSAAAMVRAVRNGVGEGGRPLVLMPSREYAQMSDEDVGKIIAYIKSLPPKDNVLPKRTLGPGAMFVIAFRLAPMIPAEWIDHKKIPPKVMPPAPTAEYGRYLAGGCRYCHGEDLAGQHMMGEPLDKPSATNITFDKETGIGTWTKAQFKKAVRYGVRPDGSALDLIMPWRFLNKLTDLELDALWAYLKSMPPKKGVNNRKKK